MKRRGSNIRRLTAWMTLMVLLPVLWACGGSETDGTDGDRDPEFTPECYEDSDCPTSQLCVDQVCVAPDGDVDGNAPIDCQSNLDCPPSMRCDRGQGVCIPLNGDGDDEDGDDDREDDRDATEQVDGDPDDEMEAEPEEEEEEAPPPPIDLSFIAPTDSHAVDGEVEIELQIVSDLTIDKVEIYAFGSLLAEFVAPPYKAFWQTAGFDEGPVELRAVAYSGEGAVAERLTAIVDHSVPELTVLSPEPGQQYGYEDTIEIQLEAGDNLEEVTLTLNGEELATITEFDDSGDVSYTFAASDLQPGSYVLDITVYDQVEAHTEATETVLFGIDNEGPQLVLTNVVWSDINPNEGEIFAEDLMEVYFDDLSGLKQVYLEIKDDYNHTLILKEARGDFPLTIDDFDDLLHPFTEYRYPMVLNIVANATDNYNQQSVFLKKLTVRRLKWQYDPQVAAPVNFVQRAGAAANQVRGDIYIAIYDELQSITADGTHRFSCEMTSPFATTPVVAERDGYPVVVFSATNDAALVARVDDNGAGPCDRFVVESALTDPAAPAVGPIEGEPDDFYVPLYYCARSDLNTRCFEIHYHVALDQERNGDSPFSIAWSTTITGYAPPTAPIHPIESGGSRNLTLGAGRAVVQLDLDSNGAWVASEYFNPYQKLKYVLASPVQNSIYATSDKEFHSYKYDLFPREQIVYSTAENGDCLENYQCDSGEICNDDEKCVSADEFLDAEPVADRLGTLFLSTQLERNSAIRGVLMAISFSGSLIEGSVWEYITEGLIGGSPAVGMDDILYVPGSNTNGNLYALDIYADVDGGERRKRWQVKLATPLLAPLLITPLGDLIAVGKNRQVHAIDVRGEAPPADASWPMAQGDPMRSGAFIP